MYYVYLKWYTGKRQQKIATEYAAYAAVHRQRVGMEEIWEFYWKQQIPRRQIPQRQEV